MRKKTPKLEIGWVWCRPGNHAVRRNRIAVHFEPGYGICGECIVRRCDKVAEYWTHGRALDLDDAALVVAGKSGIE